jgi:antitoxin HicB
MYSVLLEPDENGTVLVTCPDLPEVTTWGENHKDAVRRAADAIEEALAARIAHRDVIPEPSGSGPIVPELPPLTEAKVALYRAAQRAGIGKAELGRRLGWHGPQIDRLLDLRHRSKIEQIDQALRVLGKRLVVIVEDAA